MRNVAKRLLMGDAAQCLLAWKYKWLEDKNQARGEAIMRRVGLRMGGDENLRDMADRFSVWKYAFLEDKNQARGEAIMRRVGGRMRNKEIALNFDAWRTNTKAGILDMWEQRVVNLELKLLEEVLQLAVC